MMFISEFIHEETYEIVTYNYKNEKILSKEDKHDIEFAKHIINIYPDFYNIKELGGML